MTTTTVTYMTTQIISVQSQRMGSGCKAVRTEIKIIEVKIDDKDISDADNMILKIMDDDDNEQTV